MSSEYTWKITHIANNDIDDTLSYIADILSNKTAAKKLFVSLNTTIENICNFPMAYPGCEYYYISDTNYRHAIIGNYILFYRINEPLKQIEILRFLYSGKNVTQAHISSEGE